MYNKNLISKLSLFTPYGEEVLDQLCSIMCAQGVDSPTTIQDGNWLWKITEVKIIENDDGDIQSQYFIDSVKIDNEWRELNEYLFTV